MKLKNTFIGLFFCLLIVLQWSFFSHLAVLGVVPNVVLILFCLFAFFEKSQSYSLAKIAILNGLLADIFFNSFFGLSIITYLVIYLFIKESLNFLMDASNEYTIIYFILIFSASLIIYGLFLGFFRHFYTGNNWIIWSSFSIFFAQILYNLVWGIICFYIFDFIPYLKKI